MSTKRENSYDIVAGPNKDVLFDSCKYACSETGEIAVRFDIAIGYTMPKNDPGCCAILMEIANIKIMGIENEDGSGESFILHGYCEANLHFYDAARKPYRFKAWYNSKKRKGRITFTEQ